MDRLRRFGRAALGIWMVFGSAIACLTILYAFRGDRNWLADLMAHYPILAVIAIASVVGPMAIAWWLSREWL